MNAPAQIIAGKALEDAIWLLETRALIRAYLEYEYQFEHLADAVDPLQEFAEASGLVAALGQDQVQRLIAKPFERYRAIVAAEIAAELGGAECDPDLPDDYASSLVRDWELADERDRHRWTGELPALAPELPADQSTPYRTPQATVDAFWFVVQLGDAERLDRWLADHPRDAAHLHKIWKSKHAVA